MGSELVAIGVGAVSSKSGVPRRRGVPRHYDRATRDEMIGEAVMLALEGATVADAVKAAVKAVNKVQAPGRYAKPIEDCFWQ